MTIVDKPRSDEGFVSSLQVPIQAKGPKWNRSNYRSKNSRLRSKS